MDNTDIKTKTNYTDSFHRILARLKKPSVIVSIISEIIAILMIFNVQVDVSAMESTLAAATSIFVTLGILSNPTTLNNGYKDDIRLCKNCGKMKRHVLVGGQLLCEDCGTKFVEVSDEDFEKIQNGELEIADTKSKEEIVILETVPAEEVTETPNINETISNVGEVLNTVSDIITELSDKK